MSKEIQYVELRNLSEKENSDLEKKVFALDLFLETSEKKSVTIDELINSDVIGNDLRSIAVTIFKCITLYPNKYAYEPNLPLDRQHYSSVDEYLLDGNSMSDLIMTLRTL